MSATQRQSPESSSWWRSNRSWTSHFRPSRLRFIRRGSGGASSSSGTGPTSCLYSLAAANRSSAMSRMCSSSIRARVKPALRPSASTRASRSDSPSSPCPSSYHNGDPQSMPCHLTDNLRCTPEGKNASLWGNSRWLLSGTTTRLCHCPWLGWAPTWAHVHHGQFASCLQRAYANFLRTPTSSFRRPATGHAETGGVANPTGRPTADRSSCRHSR